MRHTATRATVTMPRARVSPALRMSHSWLKVLQRRVAAVAVVAAGVEPPPPLALSRVRGLPPEMQLPQKTSFSTPILYSPST